MIAASQERWSEFWKRLGANNDPLPCWHKLRASYSESWRAYHNLNHISHCLTEFDNAKELVVNPNAVETAIWFHDAIYNTRQKDNEERSADLADEFLAGAGISKGFRQSVRELILVTKHNQTPSDSDASLLVDVDLSILGQTPELYAEFEENIRQEYAWVSPADFAAGRSGVLQSFLNRESIFNSEPFRRKYEPQARVNLAWAIKRLAI